MRYASYLILLVFSTAIHAESYPSLWQGHSPYLQKKLEKLVGDMKLTGPKKQKSLAVVVVDITDPRQPQYAAVNPETMLYAASLPKIAILLGAFVQIEAGKIKPDDALWLDMTAMIRSSNNAAATRVLGKVGREQLLEILQSPRFLLYDREHNGGLWVGKDYGPGVAYKRDPLHNLSHGASVMQTARFYYLLETRQLVGPELTKRMKEILSKPALSHKFVKGLNDVAGAKIYRKSGTWKDYHADSALVEVDDHKFIIVALAQSKQGSRWLVNLAQPLIEIAMDPSERVASLANDRGT
ncbi:class A beta-lactamase-related serine hydrolase [Gammaproteobacteria bacterium]|nr:class A beta-lactamase-related serine hydrolase [Gammaproteobacteria bacterium]